MISAYVGPKRSGAVDKTIATYDQRVRVLVSRMRSPSGSINMVHVVELTAAGCMIERCPPSTRPDDRVLLGLPGLRYLPAIVVWIEEGRAGLAFEELLYEPVRNHLLKSFEVICN